MQRVWHRKGDGWFYATVLEAGRQKQRKLHKGPDTSSERKKAEEQLIKTLAESLGDEPLPKETRWLTVGHLIDGFLAHSKREHDQETAKWYGDMLLPFKSLYGSLPAQGLKKSHVLGYAKKRYDNPTSQNKAVVVVKRVYAWAADMEHIRHNPIAHVRKPNKSKPRDRVLEPEERLLIEQSIKDDAFREYFMALSLTGCRPGEVARVTADDCDLEKGFWDFEKHKNARHGKERVVYLVPELIDLCRRLCVLRPTGPLFLNKNGGPWTRNAIRCRFRRLRAKFPQLKGVVAYTLRHSFATDALERGIADADVAALMGNSPAVLHAWYSKLSKRREHLRRMAARATAGDARPGTRAESA